MSRDIADTGHARAHGQTDRQRHSHKVPDRPLTGPTTGQGALAQRWHHQPPERTTITYREHAVTAAWRVTPVHYSDPCELIFGLNEILSAACDSFFQALAKRIRVVNP